MIVKRSRDSKLVESLESVEKREERLKFDLDDLLGEERLRETRSLVASMETYVSFLNQTLLDELSCLSCILVIAI